jgi:hypothetical protein
VAQKTTKSRPPAILPASGTTQRNRALSASASPLTIAIESSAMLGAALPAGIFVLLAINDILSCRGTVFPRGFNFFRGDEGDHGDWPFLQDDLDLPLCDQEDRRWTPSHRSSDTGTENSALKPLLSPAARTTCAAPLPILYQPATFLAVHFRVPGNTLLCHVHEAGLSGSPRIQKFTLRQAASWPIYL